MDISQTTLEHINHSVMHNSQDALALIEFASQKSFFTPDFYELWFISLLVKNMRNTADSQLVPLLQQAHIFHIVDTDALVNKMIKNMKLCSDKAGDTLLVFREIGYAGVILDDEVIEMVAKLRSFSTSFIFEKNHENIAKRLEATLSQQDNRKSIKI